MGRAARGRLGAHVRLHIGELTEGEYLVYRAMQARCRRYHWLEVARNNKAQGLPFHSAIRFAKDGHREYLESCNRPAAEHARQVA